MFADLDPNEGYETLKNVAINNHRISNRNVWEKPVKALYHMHGPFGAHRPKGENPCLKLIFRQKPSFAQRFRMKESLNSYFHEHKELKNDIDIFNAFAATKPLL